jgi:hypothetical protein
VAFFKKINFSKCIKKNLPLIWHSFESFFFKKKNEEEEEEEEEEEKKRKEKRLKIVLLKLKV